MDYQDLQFKIRNLSSKVDQSRSLFSNTSKHDWDNIFELCHEINEGFKNVKYPSKNDRDIAWQSFFDLRNKAYETRKEQAYNRSERHYDDIMTRLHNIDYDPIGDFIVGKVMSLGLLKETADDMRSKGKALGNIGSYFKSVKHEMIGEHKTNIHERMLEIRRNHDAFWGGHKSYQVEKNRIYQEKQRIWHEKQEKSRQIRQQIENNLERNSEKLDNAKTALERFEERKRDLKNKIYDSRNDNWKWKAEGWVSELDEKIRSLEDQIRRIESWIEEDRSKLRNWR